MKLTQTVATILLLVTCILPVSAQQPDSLANDGDTLVPVNQSSTVTAPSATETSGQKLSVEQPVAPNTDSELLLTPEAGTTAPDTNPLRDNPTDTLLTAPADTALMQVPDSLAAASNDTVKRRSIFRKLIDYFDDSNEDQTKHKKIDFSWIVGPSYSGVTKFTLGLLASGLYRIDRSDTITPPSNVTVFGTLSTSGFYMLGVSGLNIIDHDRHRVSYETYFNSMPKAFWGIGYDMGRDSTATSMVQKSYQIDAEYQYNILPNTYIGAAVSFSYMNAHKLKRPDYLLGQSAKYTNTGVGVSLQYDSRDFIQNPYKGVYVNLKQMVFPAFMSSSETFWRTTFTADYYQRVWKGGILAFDFYMEYNSGKEVPWCMMAQAGGGYRLRGYYRGRYRDKAMIETQLELRQKIYRRNGIAVWVGTGNVFPKFSQFEWKRTLPDYGIGYRWEFKHRVNIRIDYGRGKHGGFITFNVNEAF